MLDVMRPDSIRTLFAVACFLLTGWHAGAQPTQLLVDPERSSIAVRTDKGGLLSAFGVGHRHGILATEWSAEICFDPQNIPASSTVISVSTPSLRIDTAVARRRAGLDSAGPNATDVQKIQEKMLAQENLAAEAHREIRFQSTTVQAKSERRFVVHGRLAIRGQTQTIALPVSFETLEGGRYRFSGQFALKQSSYGIKPESVGGVVNVKDGVIVFLDIQATETAEACE